jgi:predicted NUDIX family phosphoesterase
MTATKSSSEEYVLVLDLPTLWSIGYFEGFSADRKAYGDLMNILEKATFKKRKDVESNPQYKQIIPYALLSCNMAFFSYRRGKLLSEERLFGNYSIGIGGHISTHDLDLFNVPYKAAMQREVLEEVEILSEYNDRVAGLINDDSNEVGKVHLGIIHVFELQEPKVKPKEKSINEPRFISVDSLLSAVAQYENWSQICIQNMNAIIGTHNYGVHPITEKAGSG